jgi:hypothetical protein
MTINLHYSTLDGFHKRKSFSSLSQAKLWAKHWMGTPEIGSTYAITGDGIGKLECSGCTLYELFDQEDWRL